MARRWVRDFLWLALAANGIVHAQEQPRAGKWEMTSVYRGMPFGGEPPARTACLAQLDLGNAPEKTLLDAAPRPSMEGTEGAPKCTYNQIRRDGAKSSWSVLCEGSRGPAAGTGSATLAAEQAELSTALEVKTPFGVRSVQHEVRARRLGDC